VTLNSVIRPSVRGAGSKAAARNRRNFRVKVVPFMSDAGLAEEMGELAARVHWIQDGNTSVMQPGELLARLRACRNEAVMTRGWDAHDDKRIGWERR
jgi:hypothetical protein